MLPTACPVRLAPRCSVCRALDVAYSHELSVLSIGACQRCQARLSKQRTPPIDAAVRDQGPPRSFASRAFHEPFVTEQWAFAIWLMNPTMPLIDGLAPPSFCVPGRPVTSDCCRGNTKARDIQTGHKWVALPPTRK